MQSDAIGANEQRAPEETAQAESVVEKWVERLGKRVALVGTVIGLLVALGGGVSSYSSRMAVVDEKLAAGSIGRDKINAKIDHLETQQSSDEQAERSHYDDLLKHATTTETDVKWIIRALKR